MGTPPDMYALSPRACDPRVSCIHIRQNTRAHVITYTCNYVCICNYEPYFGEFTIGGLVAIILSSKSNTHKSLSELCICDICTLAYHL